MFPLGVTSIYNPPSGLPTISAGGLYPSGSLAIVVLDDTPLIAAAENLSVTVPPIRYAVIVPDVHALPTFDGVTDSVVINFVNSFLMLSTSPPPFGDGCVDGYFVIIVNATLICAPADTALIGVSQTFPSAPIMP